MESFTCKDVAELTGLSKTQVKFYVMEGVIYPGVDDGRGRGRVRRYTLENLRQFYLLRVFIGYGVTLSVMSAIFEKVRMNDLRSRFLVIYDGGDVEFTDDLPNFSKLGAAIIINIPMAIGEALE